MQQLIDLLWQTLLNPNIVYLLLVAGIWAAILAVITPGTGVPEAGAVIFLGLAALGLARLPVNVAGLALVALSAGLFVLELRFPAHGAVVGAGVITLAVGSLFLFRADAATAGVSLGIIGATVIVTAAFFAFAINKALIAGKRPPVQNPNAVIGATGQAKTDISADDGAVQVGSELWSAQSDEPIPAGSKVQVVTRTGLKLKVVRIGSGAHA